MPFAVVSDLAAGLDDAISWFLQLWPEDSLLHLPFFVKPLLAILLVSFLCGAMGSIVVSCKMAFFSDALAHCAFAGVALGLLIGLILGVNDIQFRHWITTIMVAFGLLIGLLIGYVKEHTGLSSDTVIGVFFAISVGLGGMFQRAALGKSYFQLDKFIFGDPVYVESVDIIWLIFLVPLTAAYLWFFFNPLVLGNFNPSLARSRRLPIRPANYLYIGLLALIINLCVQIMGVLLISGMLIVPAATASLLARNMRQFFWLSIAVSVFCGIVGIWLANVVQLPDPANPRRNISFGISGAIVVLCGLLFVMAMTYQRVRGRRI